MCPPVPTWRWALPHPLLCPSLGAPAPHVPHIPPGLHLDLPSSWTVLYHRHVPVIPEYIAAQCRLAEVLVLQRQYPRAQELLEEALKADVQCGETLPQGGIRAHFLLGCVQRRSVAEGDFTWQNSWGDPGHCGPEEGICMCNGRCLMYFRVIGTAVIFLNFG